MTEMQSDFEEWALGGYVLDRSKYGGYLAEETSIAWQAWQASRAAVVVKLPDWFVSGIGAAMYRDDVIKALDEAGVDYEQ